TLCQSWPLFGLLRDHAVIRFHGLAVFAGDCLLRSLRELLRELLRQLAPVAALQSVRVREVLRIHRRALGLRAAERFVALASAQKRARLRRGIFRAALAHGIRRRLRRLRHRGLRSGLRIARLTWLTWLA